AAQARGRAESGRIGRARLRDLSCARRQRLRGHRHGGLPHAQRTSRLIGRIAGVLVAKQPPQILVDVRGIGYELDVPMSTLYNLPATGSEVTLLTHLVVREDAHQLYGFSTEGERTLFRKLLKISGIGARTALAVLS